MTAIAPSISQGLTPEQFASLVALVKARKSDPAAQAYLENDPEVAVAWANFQQVLDRAVQSMNATLRYAEPEKYAFRPFARQLRRDRGGIAFCTQERRLYTPELAIVLGEIGRLAALGKDELHTERVATVALDPAVRTALGDQAHLEAIYPVIDAASDLFFRVYWKAVAPGEEGLALPLVLDVVQDLTTLQAVLDPARKDRVITRANIGTSVLPHMAERLASAKFLSPTVLPDAFQYAYERSWHTAPRTKVPTGGFVHGLREWAISEASPELLVVLAASSDGRNRGVAGLSANTPTPVYDKMIYDNSLGVLLQVVQNERFDNNRAYAMLDTGLAHQTSAVMLEGRVDTAIRVLACERAIRHEGVDPMHVYRFLAPRTKDPNVPHALWRDLIREMQRRLVTARMAAESAPTTQDREKAEKAVAYYAGRVAMFAREFVEDLLKPYWKAQTQAERLENHTLQTSWTRRQAAQHREFVKAHEFVADPELLDVVFEGTTKVEDVVQLIKYLVEAKLPITERMMVKIFKHDDRRVREQGYALVGAISADEVERMAKTLEQRVAEDYAAVKDHVFTQVIPEYEPIDGEPRLLSRMHHYFEAAKDIPLEELVRVFVVCAEKDPRTIPEAFRDITMLRRSAARIQARFDVAEASGPVSEAFDVHPLLTANVQQAELFGEGFAPSSSSVKKPTR